MTGEDDGCIKTELFDVSFGRDALVGEVGEVEVEGKSKSKSKGNSGGLLLHSASTAFPRGKRLARLRNCGHFLFAEKPEKAAAILSEFFDECEALAEGASLPPVRTSRM